MSDRPFTYQYRQPPGYRFCQDSVLFPKFVAEEIRGLAIGPDFRALDVCAGCGVIGLELAFHEPRLARIDFLELQSEEFEEPFLHNRALAGRGDDDRFWKANYQELTQPENHGVYDLIVANPPYFFPGDGRLAPSDFQNRCRFFLDSDLATLLKGIASALKTTGQAFLLMKSGRAHGRDTLRQARLILTGLASVDAAATIRGTLVVRIKRV